MVRQPGAVRMTGGARLPHSGQADGSSHSAIGRNCVNGPHFLHIYSYVGIDHLHPGKTHPAADQSVAIMETIPVDSWVVNVIDHFLPRQLMALLGPTAMSASCPLLRGEADSICSVRDFPSLMWWTAPAPGIEVP